MAGNEGSGDSGIVSQGVAGVGAAMKRLARGGGGSAVVGDRVVTCEVEGGRVVGWGLVDIRPEEYPGGALVVSGDDFGVAGSGECGSGGGEAGPDLAMVTRLIARVGEWR